MTVWVNILSACNHCAETLLPEIAASLDCVGVFSTVDNRFIGHTLRAEVRDRIDLWAELELEPHRPFARAAAVLKKEPGGPVTIIAVLATDLPREAIHRLAYDMASN